MKESRKHFDMIFASGVLYHMTDPASVIELISNRTDKCFVWMHYWDNKIVAKRTEKLKKFKEVEIVYHILNYGKSSGEGRFWGGIEEYSSWMKKEDIEKAFRTCGFLKFDIVEETPDHPNGPSFSFCASK